MKTSFFNALGMAPNCPSATPGTWGGETINPLWGNPVSLPERGMPGCHSKGEKNEIIETEEAAGSRHHHTGGIRRDGKGCGGRYCGWPARVMEAGFAQDGPVYKQCSKLFMQNSRPAKAAVCVGTGKVTEMLNQIKEKDFRQVIPILGEGDDTLPELATYCFTT